MQIPISSQPFNDYDGDLFAFYGRCNLSVVHPCMCPSFCSHHDSLMSPILWLIKNQVGDGWKCYANVKCHLPRELVAMSATFWKASRNIPAAIMVCLEEKQNIASVHLSIGLGTSSDNLHVTDKLLHMDNN